MICALTAAFILSACVSGELLQRQPGYETFCAHQPALCAVANTTPVTLTSERRDELAAVNTAVNHSIRYRAMPGQRWAIGPREGDCDDYAATKLAALVAKGWPRSALRLVIGLAHDGTPHAALEVETTDGAVFLDNRHDEPVDMAADRVLWLAIEMPESGRMRFELVRL